MGASVSSLLHSLAPPSVVQEQLSPLSSPVPVAMYPMLSTVFLALGLLLTGVFFLYQVSHTRHDRVLVQELALGGISSVALGLGAFFLLLWTGVYV